MADEILPQTLYETEDPPPAEEPEERGTLTEEMLRRILDDNRQANADLIRQVTTPRGQPLQQDSVAPELEFSLEGLPDPAMDPAGFHKGYAARATQAVKKALEQQRQVVTSEAQRIVEDKDVIASSRAMIKGAIPDADEEIIAYAGGVVANRLKAQGKNPMAEMRMNTESVSQDIVDYIDDLRGRLGGTGRASDVAAGGRTRGLVQPRARTPNLPKQQDAKEDPKAFYKELTQFQQKARIY